MYPSLLAHPANRARSHVGAWRRPGSAIALLVVAAVTWMLLQAGGAAQAPETARPRAQGGQGPVVELPPAWQPEPARLYRWETLSRIQTQMPGMAVPGVPPMDTRTRQEVTLRTSHPDRDGHLYAVVSMGPIEVLEGPPEVSQPTASTGAATVHLRLTPQGGREVLGFEDERGEPVQLEDEGFLEALALLAGPFFWPEAPRVGSTWERPLSGILGPSAGLGLGVPDVAVTARLEGVDGAGAEQVARVRFELPESRVEVSLEELGMMELWVKMEGESRVRVRDGMTLASHVEWVTRMRMPGGPALAAGSPEILTHGEIEERIVGEEVLADPPDRPW